MINSYSKKIHKFSKNKQYKNFKLKINKKYTKSKIFLRILFKPRHFN